jgi:glycerol-3-phosphate dehydrogenase
MSVRETFHPRGSRPHFFTGMRRDLTRLADTTFDLLVIGAGIYGACTAWDASLRGLSVAVIDQDDFGAATSANSLRIVHGGLRYLARGDFPRMLESIRERSTLLRIAPELVEPLPVLVPTYRGASRNRVAHGLALAVNDLVSCRRNRGLDPDRLIPRGRLVSRAECLRFFPNFSPEGLTGGALWYDARLRHPERLTLSFLLSAAGQGAVPANYLRVERLQVRDGTVQGAWVTDRIGGSEFEIRARMVVVAAGPWTPELIAGTPGAPRRPARRRAVAVNVVLGRRLAEVAVGVQARSGPGEDPVCGGHRFLFFAPQGRTTVLGTWYSVANADPRAACERGVRSLVRELNETCPGLGLTPADVARYQWGWLPLKAGAERGRADALAERPRIVEHGRRDGIRHLFSVEGVKYTTARSVAERVVDRVVSALGRSSPPCRTAAVPLERQRSEMLIEPGVAAGPTQIRYAVREEMARKLGDIIFRRSDLGMPPGPDRATLQEVARLAGIELGWDAMRQEAEIEDVMRQTGVPGPAMEAVG